MVVIFKDKKKQLKYWQFLTQTLLKPSQIGFKFCQLFSCLNGFYLSFTDDWSRPTVALLLEDHGSDQCWVVGDGFHENQSENKKKLYLYFFQLSFNHQWLLSKVAIFAYESIRIRHFLKKSKKLSTNWFFKDLTCQSGFLRIQDF